MQVKTNKRGPLFEKDVPAVVRKCARPALESAARYLAARIQSAAPVALGGLKQSIGVHKRSQSVSVRAAQWYGIPVDKGRRAAPVRIAPLVLWAQRKLGGDARTARRAAYAISRHKSMHATAAKNFFFRTFDREQGTVQQMLLGPIASSIVGELG